ncbi:MAG: PD-(D/E)XK nuclease family protein, partial [Nostocaceae cyanobacterium]|nr:PD-(D/E)XK nuclease family protein [Nostocaceae cyanobacterium]
MQYLNKPAEIQNRISQLASAKILWLDTEIADWNTPRPRLSLIQVLASYTDLTEEHADILDVLDKPDLARDFISQIMVNLRIEKVFHNASFDLRYLGGNSTQNITCTLRMARKITRDRLQVSDLKLKTLATELCHFSNVDKEEQGSDWGKRPLTQKQLQYAAMDVIYLASVHRRLLEISHPSAVSNILDMVNTSSTNLTSAVPDNSSLSVTKVRVALECPRLFYLNHKFASKTVFLPSDISIGIGNIFHDLANKFVNLAINEPKFEEFFQPVAAQLQVDEVAAKMQNLFYKLKFSTYLLEADKTEVNQAALLQVWQGLQRLIKHLAKLLIINRRYCSANTVIARTFVSEENKLEHYFHLPNGTQQRVAGIFDCLVFNLELQRLCVVEFKTYHPIDPSAQLAQVALYSYMLWKKKKVPVDSAVYCVLPEFKEYHYTWEELENTVHQLIPHKLQQMQQWLTWEPPQLNPPPSTTQPELCKICP